MPDHDEDRFRSLERCPDCSGCGAIDTGEVGPARWTGGLYDPPEPGAPYCAPCPTCDATGWLSVVLADEVPHAAE